jgi:hypothetical protein
MRAATARGRTWPDHKQMQFARLESALRLAARGVAEGDVKTIPLLIKLLDRVDRYCEPAHFDAPPLLGSFFSRPKRRRARRGSPEAGVDFTDLSDEQTWVALSERGPVENAQNDNGQAL